MQPTTEENNRNQPPPEKFTSSVETGSTCSSITASSSPTRPQQSASQGDVSCPDQKSSFSPHSGAASGECTSSIISNGQEDVEQVSEDINRYADSLADDDKSNPPEVPHTVEAFSKIIESRIDNYYSHSGETARKRVKKMTEEDAFFIEAVMRLSKLTNAFSEFPPSETLNRTSFVLQKAMAFLEEEMRFLLEDSKLPPPPDSVNPNTHHHHQQRIAKNSSFSSKDKDSSDHHRQSSSMNGDHNDGEDDFPGYSPDTVTKMNRIASAMISAGYEKECCQVYSISRRSIFNQQLKKLEYDKLNMDDVLRMSWESLETEIKRWLTIVKHCSKLLFPAEKQLGETVFAHHPSLSTSIFSNLARAVVIQFLDFAGAVSLTKRSAEKLFKFLDMYETLLDLIPSIITDDDCCEHELRSEVSAAAGRLGEAAINIFLDLENSIKNDVAKTAVPGGAVHPLTRYVLNYLKYACEYKGTLEKIFEKQAGLDQNHSLCDSRPAKYTKHEESEGESSPHNLEHEASTTRFSVQVVTVMDLLDANLEAKSLLYKDPSLRYIFLMNNGRYILQKAKGSTEIHQVMGDNWCRRRSTVVRQFHKNYQRESWVRLLHSLSHEGLIVNGKVNKPTLKERFKNFNTMLEEIHKLQSTWVVSDDQLRTELRLSVAAVVIPAYRSFLGKFRQYLDSSKQVEKYIKYQPEDIEALIEELFDGNPTSMGRRR
ncbi:exocyst complex component EXO70C1-like [Coffea arabica]|uniref:Exocyst subunit Exo70 family protein n=1 Tax=Coffea arabica TaxID=13443 RepID=A0A6P6V8V1_COFAR|nr:exocyst complex component EXO70B1-like [Coffea arabica]